MVGPIKEANKEDRRDLAADYVVRLHSGEMSDQDRAAMEVWLAKDEKNKVELQRFFDTWHSVGALASRKHEMEASIRRSSLGRWSMAAGFLLATLVTLLLVVEDEDKATRPTLASYETGVGEQRSVLLKDGTRVTLNTNSKLLVNFSGDARNVTLRQGEAFFEVAHDSSKPFTVNTGLRSVTVLGTKFDVRKSGFGLVVEVVEGSVAVHQTGHRATPASVMVDLLANGQEVPQKATKYRIKAGVTGSFSGSMGEESAKVDVASLNVLPDKYPNWKHGLVSFDRASLYEVVKEFNRYLDRKILIEDAEIMNLKVSGVFQLDAIDLALQRMESAFPMQVIEYSDRIVMTGRDL